ncbi:MAG TPA: hypothetical protein VFV49_01615 [Thermoanaerobaculia bacterium]|nr:hypothetical protein [Thermoanaerobaculia bacterium]
MASLTIRKHLAEQPDGAWSLIVQAVDEAMRVKMMLRESRPSP